MTHRNSLIIGIFTLLSSIVFAETHETESIHKSRSQLDSLQTKKEVIARFTELSLDEQKVMRERTPSCSDADPFQKLDGAESQPCLIMLDLFKDDRFVSKGGEGSFEWSYIRLPRKKGSRMLYKGFFKTRNTNHPNIKALVLVPTRSDDIGGGQKEFTVLWNTVTGVMTSADTGVVIKQRTTPKSVEPVVPRNGRPSNP